MARSKNGQPIRESQRTAQKLVQLDELLQEAAALEHSCDPTRQLASSEVP